jgi:hypothetical protein
VVATARESDRAVLGFAAHHLWLGAHRVRLYLDAPGINLPSTDTVARLRAHPCVRVIRCTDAWWAKRGGKPLRHQARQTRNATHAYARSGGIDWLAHVDVDEFLWPEAGSVADTLARLPRATLCARMRPEEALAGSASAYKRRVPPGAGQARRLRRVYPGHGPHLRGGFLSHVAGKLFVRTGLRDARVRIHTLRHGGQVNPGQTELGDITILHRHAKTWDDWHDAFRYRLARGAYRAEVTGGPHSLLTQLADTGGEAALRAFFDSVCADTPALRARLDAEGLLRHADLRLETRIAQVFGSGAQALSA